MVWPIDFKTGTVSEPKYKLYGHDNEITSVEINEILSIVVSGDKNGTVIMHDLNGYEILKRFEHKDREIKNIRIHNYGIILIIFENEIISQK